MTELQMTPKTVGYYAGRVRGSNPEIAALVVEKFKSCPPVLEIETKRGDLLKEASFQMMLWIWNEARAHGAHN